MLNNYFKEPWSYTTGAVVLAFLNTMLFIMVDKPWQITTGFTYWAAWIYQGLGGSPELWPYFAESSSRAQALTQGFFSNDLSLMDFGIIVGALLAVLLASQFKFKKIKSFKQFSAALLGGIIMGYGTRIAMGCNIGAFFSSIPSLSLGGWVFAVSAFLGAWVGGKVLIKYLL
ncbi:MAG: YeeE/YedE thiosulfate transporter family protein [Bacillota bacterium]